MEIAENAGEVVEVLAEKSTIVRTIGVEIECLVPSYQDIEDVESDLGDVGGRTTSDGSIDGDGEGLEVKTHPIKGDEAEKTIKDICAVLEENSADTNTTCGMHVHVDAKEINLNNYMRGFESIDDVKDGEIILYVDNDIAGGDHVSERYYDVLARIEVAGSTKVSGRHGTGRVVFAEGSETHYSDDIMPASEWMGFTTFVVNYQELTSLRTRVHNAMRFFSAIDPILRSLVPSSRRHNTYCQPFEKIARSGGRCPSTTKELIHGVSGRYCGINIEALSAHGTIENRYHGGTIDAEKIIHWARLWERCVNVALSSSANTEADALAEVCNGKNRLEMLLALTGVPESTEKYMLARYTRFMGSDARHAISYIKNKKARRVAATY